MVLTNIPFLRADEAQKQSLINIERNYKNVLAEIAEKISIAIQEGQFVISLNIKLECVQAVARYIQKKGYNVQYKSNNNDEALLEINWVYVEE